MSKYSAYRNRINATSGSFKDSVIESTKRQQEHYFLHSPSLSRVTIENEKEAVPCIVSNKDNFHIRKFLFLPDSIIDNGTSLIYKELRYLTTDNNMDEIYPEAVGELCNDVFKLSLESERIQVGVDDFNRPIYEIKERAFDIPCVARTKYYSETENASIPLPAGSMIVKIPYKVDYEIPLNYIADFNSQKFQVTNISYENVLNDVGYIEINLQRVVTSNGS